MTVLQLAAWQWTVVGVTAVACAGYMSIAVARMFARHGELRGVARPGTDAETGLYGGVAPEGASVYDAFSYRVTARFAGRVRVVVTDDAVVMCGPRVARGLYVGWIWVQSLLLALVPAALVAAAVTLDARWLAVAAGLFVCSLGISGLGAGLWPGLGEVAGLSDEGRLPALEVPLAAVSDVTLGKGWSNGGLQVVLLPYVGGIDQMAAGHAVSWDGPDADGRIVRFSAHLNEAADAEKLAAQLRAGQ